MVGKVLTSRYTTDRTIHDILVPIAEQRLEEVGRQRLGHKVAAHVRNMTPCLLSTYIDESAA